MSGDNLYGTGKGSGARGLPHPSPVATTPMLRRATFGLYPTREEANRDAYQFGNPGTPAAEALRPLSDAERATNTVWSWSPELGTFVSPEYPTGIA